ncbi:glycosyltransferase family 2 protein [Dyadobacter pollutisoli]|uniref:Glycosyltransferase family 2 protein n=1 Tax=Dyadobacter pollutisoli TaxID=2910158 RepID=A0A9E8SN17_9BACT|nr:glycosyltransferase family 2 protein [Dyadobacter pollutisoli]WAC14778.1 glycosyltransferase family 2 protein [Dyadobacter pollutisoli]
MKNSQPSHQPSISIVLPCYNPGEGWCSDLLRNMACLREKLPEHFIQFIISNDGSTRLERHQLCMLTSFGNVVFLDNPRNEGKGSAIRKGACRACGDIIIYTDLDFPFGTDAIVEMVSVFENNPGCSFVYGNRSMEYFQKLPLKRKLFSKMLRITNRLTLSQKVADTQAGIKGLRKEILPIVQQVKTNTFVFEIELIHKLLREGIGIEKIEVCANPSIVFTDFNMKVLFREAVNFTRIITAGLL